MISCRERVYTNNHLYMLAPGRSNWMAGNQLYPAPNENLLHRLFDTSLAWCGNFLPRAI